MSLKETLIHFGLYLLQNAIAADRAVNAFLGGSAEETLSSRAYRMQRKRQPVWGWTAYAINCLFFWQKDSVTGKRNHCERSWRREMARRDRAVPTDLAGAPVELWEPLDS